MEPWVGTIFSTMLMGSKVDGLRLMYASLISMNRETQQSINHTWVMERRVYVMRPISNSPITIGMILKGRVDGLLRNKSISSIITDMINTFFHI